MKRSALFLALLTLACGPGRAPAAPAPDPITLVETRPLETALGDTTLPATAPVWVDMIDGARTTLDLEHFYVSERPGEALSPVLAAIGRAAARGVRVRLLIDAGMHRTYPMPADSLGRLPNVTLRLVNYRKLAGGVQHSKFMIADGQDAFLGSQNLDWRALSHIHELGARVRVPEVATALASVFEADWAAADTTAAFDPGTAPPAASHWPVAFEQDGVVGQVWFGASPRSTTPAGIPWELDLMKARIDGAQREVVAQSLGFGVRGYGQTDSTLYNALVAAAARGVHVKLLISDWEVGGNGEPDLRALAARPNVEVRISRVPWWSRGYIPFARVEHCKYMVVDGEWLWLGTGNWEPSYFLSTRNVSITVHHAPLAARARGIFEQDWSGPTALAFGPDTRIEPRPHGMEPPSGVPFYGE